MKYDPDLDFFTAEDTRNFQKQQEKPPQPTTETLLETLLALDLETTGLDPLTDKIRLASITILTPTGFQKTALIDLFKAEGHNKLTQILAKPNLKIIGHNLKFDLGFLKTHNIPVASDNLFDTMLAYQILTNGLHKPAASLEAIAKDLLGITLNKQQQTSNWNTENLLPEQLEYAKNDTKILIPLYQKLTPKLTDLKKTTLIEMGTIKPIIELEINGCYLDKQTVENKILPTYETKENNLIKQLLELLIEAEFIEPPAQQLQLFSNTPETTTNFNHKSQPQVKAALNHLGIKTEGTSKNELCLIASKSNFIQALLEARTISSIISTYLKGRLINSHHQKTNRIHPKWNQLGADSGRIISSNPTLQNMPRDKEFRSCFKAEPGNIIVSADFSQIELRIIAKITGDKEMNSSYLKGEDLHRKTACYVLSKNEITKEERQLGKAINFGLVYGMMPEKFQIVAARNYKTYLSLEEAKLFRKRYFELYKGIAKYHKDKRRELKEMTKTCKYISKSLLGRQRLWQSNNPPTLNEIINNPVQSTCSDLIKLTLIAITKKLQKYQAKLILVIHDEIVLEVPEKYATKTEAMLVKTMKKAGQLILDPIPCEVDSKSGPSW